MNSLWCLAFAGLLLLPTTGAHANGGGESSVANEPAARRALSAQVAFGLGAGDLGLGAVASGSVRYWFAPKLAIGVEGGAIGEAELAFGRSAATWFVAPEIAYRIGDERAAWLFSVAPGYARTSAFPGNTCLLGPCVQPPSREGHGYVIDVMAGNVWTPGALVLGAGLRFDLVHPLLHAEAQHGLPRMEFVGTLQLILGFAP